MKWIGLTGGIGSGKSSVTGLLRAKSIPVVDADQIAKEVVQIGRPGYQQVVLAFGPEVLSASGELDRAMLAQKVFGKTQDLLRLEAIIHPLVQAEVRQQRANLETAGHRMAFYDVPLLFEKNLEDQFDAVVLVWCTEAQQVERTLKRGNISPADLHRRLQSQIPMDQKRNKSDIVIDNSGPETALSAAVDKALNDISNLK